MYIRLIYYIESPITTLMQGINRRSTAPQGQVRFDTFGYVVSPFSPIRYMQSARFALGSCTESRTDISVEGDVFQVAAGTRAHFRQ